MSSARWIASPIQCDLLGELTRARVAADVAAAIRVESARRTSLARAVLGDGLLTGTGTGYRAFLPLPPRSGIRVCLGAPSCDQLARGPGVLAEVLDHVRGRRERRHAD